MGRCPQARSWKGSQRWLQTYVNDAPGLLNERIGLGEIEWLSPLADDEYAEYRDQAFLHRVRADLPRRKLATFWPSGGPQWDGLGRATSGEVVLVEAKAHVNELYSPSSAASASSLARIQLSLRETARALGAADGFDWSKQFYQYANRLAHAFLLDSLNGVPTKLAFLYFMGDRDVGGPSTCAEWQAATDLVHGALGLRHVPGFVVDVFADVRQDFPGV